MVGDLGRPERRRRTVVPSVLARSTIRQRRSSGRCSGRALAGLVRLVQYQGGDRGAYSEQTGGRGAMSHYEIRDLEQARRFVLQGLWWQRVVPPSAGRVREVLEWAKEVASAGQPLPPVGFLADVGHV